MSWATIHKSAGELRVTPNLLNYDALCELFTWDDARAALDGLPGGRGLNIAYEAVDRHVAAGNGDRVAMRWLGRHGEREEWTYTQLSERSNRFAGALREMRVRPGERVFALLTRIPDLYVAALGTLKARCVLSPSSQPSVRSRSLSDFVSGTPACWSLPSCCTDARLRESGTM